MKHLVAVYGTLRKGGYNSYLLADSKFLGSHQTEPIFTLYSLGSFPAVTKDGSTSIFIEVYEVDEDTLFDLYRLEGYNGIRDNKLNAYDTLDIETPYGKAEMFYIKRKFNAPIVKSGKWGI